MRFKIASRYIDIEQICSDLSIGLYPIFKRIEEYEVFGKMTLHNSQLEKAKLIKLATVAKAQGELVKARQIMQTLEYINSAITSTATKNFVNEAKEEAKNFCIPILKNAPEPIKKTVILSSTIMEVIYGREFATSETRGTFSMTSGGNALVVMRMSNLPDVKTFQFTLQHELTHAYESIARRIKQPDYRLGTPDYAKLPKTGNSLIDRFNRERTYMNNKLEVKALTANIIAELGYPEKKIYSSYAEFMKALKKSEQFSNMLLVLTSDNRRTLLQMLHDRLVK